MQGYNILYLPLFILLISIYLLFIVAFGIFINIQQTDEKIINYLKYLNEKKYIHILAFILNAVCWYFAYQYGLKTILYKIINYEGR